jgi:TonB family protein
MMTIALLANRRGIEGTNGTRVSRALMVSSGIALALFLLMLVLKPIRETELVKVVLPERATTLIQAKPLPEPPAPRSQVQVERVADLATAQLPDHFSLPPPKTHLDEPDPDKGKLGQQRAREATAQLASASDPMDKSLDDLARALSDRVNATPEPGHHKRERGVGGGRAADAIGAIDAGLAGSGRADLDHSGVEGTQVAIGSLAASKATDAAGTDDPSARGSAPGIYRSNASLLAVIQRYQAGIQYCYGNELKRDASLRGKLVVALTVTAAGQVSEAIVVQNTLGSERLSSCALAQIREWKFPPIASGVTTFQVPFVFTPPN